MVCPVCKSGNHFVKDSRPVKDAVRRRRECNNCGARWFTIEKTIQDCLKIPEEYVADFDYTSVFS